MDTDLRIKAAEKLEAAAIAIRELDVNAEYKKRVEPVEKVIQEHPIPSVLVGVGAGIIIGVMIFKYHNRLYY